MRLLIACRALTRGNYQN